MNNTKICKKHFPIYLISALSLALVLAVLFLIFSNNSNIKNKFPQWEVASEAPQTQEGITLSLDYIEHALPESGRSTDSVFLLLEKEKDTTCGPNYWVDHLYKDTWYTVYDANIQSEYAQVLGGGTGTSTLEYAVPSGLFQVVGLYRLCIDGLGTVPIDILVPVT